VPEAVVNVSKIEYTREVKRLAVIFEDGTRHIYRVDPPAADAMIASGSLQHHFEKYIQGIYHPISEERP
jgi:hypothetical protein